MDTPSSSGHQSDSSERAVSDSSERAVTSTTTDERKKFVPADHGLRESFRLTDYAECWGTRRKVPQSIVNELFGTARGDGRRDEASTPNHRPYTVTASQHGLMLVQSSELFYPVTDDPYVMGRIACNGVLSDLYSLGVTECDNILMFLSVSTRMTEQQRDAVVPFLIRGFKDAAKDAGCGVTGGQTVVNPWLSIGGAATSACLDSELIPRDAAVAGDVLVLTKPLGVEAALVGRARMTDPEFSKRVRTTNLVTDEDMDAARSIAVDTMARSNRIAATLMHKYEAHCATTVGELGVLGHATDLVQMQANDLIFKIHNLPVIAKMATLDRICGQEFRLMQGLSRETCGGLLVCVSQHISPFYINEVEKVSGHRAWIVGIVEAGDRCAEVVAKARFIDVPSEDAEGGL